MKLLHVTWVDSSSCYGWQDKEVYTKKLTPLVCVSVGFLVKETKGYIILVPHLSLYPDGTMSHRSGDIMIPKKVIQKRKVIKT